MDRLLMIVGGYLLACAAAGFSAGVLLIVVPGTIQHLVQGRGFPSNVVALVLQITVYGGMAAAIFAFLPTAALVAYAEVRRRRSAAFYGIAGVSAAIITWGLPLAYLLTMMALDPTLRPPGVSWSDVARQLLFGSEVTLLLLMSCLGGLVAGLVYWWIAGEHAGAWRDQRDDTAAP